LKKESGDLSIALPADLVEAIADRAGELVLERLAELSTSEGQPPAHIRDRASHARA
jgi:hypothetical protein